MRASDVSCDVISGLMGRWRDGDLPERDSNAYEQHLLFCPPCLIRNDKARLALDALRGAATAAPGDDLRDRLVRLAQGER
jgi:Putative zinc-finger